MALASAPVSIEFPSRFRIYAEAAVLKLQIRYPEVSFALRGNEISASSESGTGAAILRRDVLHAIYAEKIYAETLSMRQALVAAVTAR
jgi:hypothetical protein